MDPEDHWHLRFRIYWTRDMDTGSEAQHTTLKYKFCTGTYFKNKQSSISVDCLVVSPRNGDVGLVPEFAEGHAGGCVSAIWIPGALRGGAGA